VLNGGKRVDYVGRMEKPCFEQCEDLMFDHTYCEIQKSRKAARATLQQILKKMRGT